MAATDQEFNQTDYELNMKHSHQLRSDSRTPRTDISKFLHFMHAFACMHACMQSCFICYIIIKLY